MRRCPGCRLVEATGPNPAHPVPLQMMPSDKTSSVFLGLQVGLSGAGRLLGAWATLAVQQPCWHPFEQVRLTPPAPLSFLAWPVLQPQGSAQVSDHQQHPHGTDQLWVGGVLTLFTWYCCTALRWRPRQGRLEARLA